MFEFSNSKKKIFTSAFFLIFFIIGVFSFSDYGISIDEDNTRISGFVSLKYVFEILSPEKALKINEITKQDSVYNKEKTELYLEIFISIIVCKFRL